MRPPGRNITYAVAQNLWIASTNCNDVGPHNSRILRLLSDFCEPFPGEIERHYPGCHGHCDGVHLFAARNRNSACLLAICGLAHSQHDPPGVVLSHVCQVLHTVQINRRRLPRRQRVQWCCGAEPPAGSGLGRVRHRGRTGKEFRPADQRSTAGELVTTALVVEKPSSGARFPPDSPGLRAGTFFAPCRQAPILMPA